MRAVVAALVLLVHAGCGAPARKPDPEPEARAPTGPDAAVLSTPTRIRARYVQVTIASGWRPFVELKGISRNATDPATWSAVGEAEFALRSVRIDGADEIKVTFLDDHEDVVIYARDVELLEHKMGRHRNVYVATIANRELTVLSR